MENISRAAVFVCILSFVCFEQVLGQAACDVATCRQRFVDSESLWLPADRQLGDPRVVCKRGNCVFEDTFTLRTITCEGGANEDGPELRATYMVFATFSGRLKELEWRLTGPQDLTPASIQVRKTQTAAQRRVSPSSTYERREVEHSDSTARDLRKYQENYDGCRQAVEEGGQFTWTSDSFFQQGQLNTIENVKINRTEDTIF